MHRKQYFIIKTLFRLLKCKTEIFLWTKRLLKIEWLNTIIYDVFIDNLFKKKLTEYY